MACSNSIPPSNCVLNREGYYGSTCIDPIDTAAMPSGPSAGGDYPNGPMEDWNDNCPLKPTLCRQPCDYSPLARVVITITYLRNSLGVNAEEIAQAHNAVICPERPLFLDQINRLLKQGTRQGIFVYNSTEQTYKVYGAFGVLPSNLQFVKELGPGFQLCLGMYCNAVS